MPFLRSYLPLLIGQAWKLGRYLLRLSILVLALDVTSICGFCEDNLKLSVPTKEQIEERKDLVVEAIKSVKDVSAGDPQALAESGVALLDDEQDAVNRWIFGMKLVDELWELNAPQQIYQIVQYLDRKYQIRDFGTFCTIFTQLDHRNRKEHLGKRLAVLGPMLSIARMASQVNDEETVRKITSYDVSRIPLEIRPSFQSAFERLKQLTGKNVSIQSIAEAAREKHKVNPNDVNSMVALGTIFILVDKNMVQGVDLFKRSRVANYQQIGELEDLSEKSPEEFFSLASLWWTVSEKMPSSLGDLARKRALDFYQISVDKLRGVKKVVAENRLKGQVSTEDGFYPVKIDLLSPTVPKRYHFSELKQTERKLVLNSEGPSFVQFEIPYTDRYDIEWKFTRFRIEWGVGFFFHISGKQYGWGFAGTKNGKLGFSGAKNPDDTDIGISNKVLSEGSHSVLLRVRPERLEATLDGKLESFVDNPLQQKYKRLEGNPPEFLQPYYAIIDWWGNTTVETAIVTQYW
jgi:hypothetical protein